MARLGPRRQDPLIRRPGVTRLHNVSARPTQGTADERLLVELSTGSVHVDALAAGGARFYASRLSSDARAMDPAATGGMNVEFVLPERLVELTFEADRVVSF